MCQTGALKSCKDDLGFQVLNKQVALGHKTIEEFTPDQKAIYDSQSLIEKEKEYLEAVKKELAEKVKQQAIK